MLYTDLKKAGALVTLICLLSQALSANDSIATNGAGRQKIRIKANAAVIVNRAFSNITGKREQTDQTSLILRTPSDSGSNVKIGFLLGAHILIGKTEKFKGTFGLSFSRTGAEYHFAYLEELTTSRPGFAKLTRTTEHDIIETYNALNVHAGIRNRLKGNFFLTSTLVFNKPVKITRVTNGYTEGVYTSTGPETDSYITYVNDEVKTYNNGEPNLSFRLDLEYQFKIKEALARIFIFRNFGMIYTLPWWGLGFAYTLKS